MATKRLNTLRRQADFENLKINGQRFAASRWLLFSFQKNNLSDCRFGWTISRKVGNAVVRNRLKRWCRDFFRIHQSEVAEKIDLNVVFKPTSIQFFQDLEHEEFIRVFEKAWSSVV